MKRRFIAMLGLLPLLSLLFFVISEVRQAPGGFEEWLGDTLSDIRAAFPVLVDPITSIQDAIHETSYEISRFLEREDPTETPAVSWPEPSQSSPASSAMAMAARLGTPPPSEVDEKPTLRASPGVVSSDAITDVPGSKETLQRTEGPTAGIPREELDWQPVPGGPSWLRTTRIVANQAFPREPLLLLSIDLRRSALHWQPGSLNPVRLTAQKERLPDLSPFPDRTGRIPMVYRRETLVAFGGGFESIHFRGHGAIHNGHVIVPMAGGLQTLVIYQDGEVRMGPWESPSLPPSGIREARQNLPPLVHEGRIPENITRLNEGTLGSPKRYDEHGKRIFTDVHTWRSGLGLTSDGTLLYAFGSRLTPGLLASALIRAGAVEAMMLDINAAYHCTPSLMRPAQDDTLAVEGLFPGINAGSRFLTGSRKDFFFALGNELSP